MPVICLVGQRFGHLEVVAQAEHGKFSGAYWACRCCCGATVVRRGAGLKAGHSKSCGCRNTESVDARRAVPLPASIADARWIPLSKGKFALVDETDFERVSKFNWSIAAKRYAAYRALPENGAKNGPYVYLHRFIIGAQPGDTVDHINHDELDNRKGNLRIASMSEQGRNKRRPNHNTSGKKGVWWDKKRLIWRAEIKMEPGKKLYLGAFASCDEAGLAYDEAATEFFSNFAFTNVDINRTDNGRRRLVGTVAPAPEVTT